jgi:hypothetical protein
VYDPAVELAVSGGLVATPVQSVTAVAPESPVANAASAPFLATMLNETVAPATGAPLASITWAARGIGERVADCGVPPLAVMDAATPVEVLVSENDTEPYTEVPTTV